MDYTYLSLGIVVVLFLLLRFAFPALFGRSGPVYARRESLFTPAEFRFLQVLRGALPKGLEIYAKVRVADVLQPAQGLDRKAWRSAFNRITGKHLDFVLCERESGRQVCAIELNDRSHERLERIDRDRFIATACTEAGFPLLMIPAAKSYDAGEILAQILEALGKQPSSPLLPVLQDDLVCPRCGGSMERKIARRGQHPGTAFLACSRYPTCRYTSEL